MDTTNTPSNPPTNAAFPAQPTFVGGNRPPVSKRSSSQGATPARLQMVARNQTEALGLALRTMIRATPILWRTGTSTEITDEQRAELREAMDILSLCVADAPASGKEILAAKAQSGFLLGPQVAAVISAPSAEAVQLRLQQIQSNGLALSEGKPLTADYVGENDSYPRVFVAARGEPKAVRALVTGLPTALEIPEGYYLACDVHVQNVNGVRALVLVEAPMDVLLQAFPMLRELPAYTDYVNALEAVHKAIDEQNGRFDLDAELAGSPLATR